MNSVTGAATPIKAGVIGCGVISGAYFSASRMFEAFEIVACADLDVERARAKAQEHSIPKACSVEELLADPGIEIVINLTIPAAHGPVGLRALQSGKSVYNEKPLAVTRDEAQRMLQTARQNGLRIGCAPDTFLGGGLQTCRKLIDEGAIGEPVAATAFMMGRGHESWHPDPAFYYQPGGGPMFDMGPYYLTALAMLLGPVRHVSGSARISFAERIIGSEPKRGQKITVEVPTHIAGTLDFRSGPVATMIMSFDVYHAPLPPITIFGSEGTLAAPDPNSFGGPVKIRRAGDEEWREVPLAFGYTENSRGVGVADMCCALRSGREHRANGELAYHVLDLMHAFHDASNEGRHIEMQSACERPAPLPESLSDGELGG